MVLLAAQGRIVEFDSLFQWASREIYKQIVGFLKDSPDDEVGNIVFDVGGIQPLKYCLQNCLLNLITGKQISFSNT